MMMKLQYSLEATLLMSIFMGTPTASHPAGVYQDEGREEGKPIPNDVLSASLARRLSDPPYWEQVGENIEGEGYDDCLGSGKDSVVMSSDGSRIAIGAWFNDVGGAALEGGHVRVYEWNSTAWVQLGTDIDGDEANDHMGYAIAMTDDGSRIAVGAPGRVNNPTKGGYVRVLEWNSTSWNQIGHDIVGENPGDRFGISLAMSSDGLRIAAGADENDGAALDAGHVRVYEWNSTAWEQLGADIEGVAATDEAAGWSVAMSANGSWVAVGSIRNDAGGDNAGHVRVFEWNSTSWEQLGEDIVGESFFDSFGWSLAMSAEGSRVAIGGILNDGAFPNAGHVQVYEWEWESASSWGQVGSDIGGAAAYDNFGTSLAISDDGSRVAVGAIYNADGGINAGHVRVFEWNSTAWEQLGLDIDGEDAFDRAGSSVAMSADGSRVAVGAEKAEDVFGVVTGHVRVFDLIQPVPPTAEPTRNPTDEPTSKPTLAPNTLPIAQCDGFPLEVGNPMPSIDNDSYDPDEDDGIVLFEQTPAVGTNMSTTGVYPVVLTVEDTHGGTDSCMSLVPVYDPEGGFVTGGGWFNSPLEAFVHEPDAHGKANFGFVSKYKKGASVPDGSTTFVFKSGDLDFESTSYDWLVITGSGCAKYKGLGLLDYDDEVGEHGFMLTACDGDRTGGDDTFRIKIWPISDEETPVYDNMLGNVSDDDFSGTAIGGGNIKIHKSSGGKKLRK